MIDLFSPETIKADAARRLFRAYVQDAWQVVEPGHVFVPGWHLDAIAEHLQAVYAGDIKRLLVNMPPRHGKSTLISVLWTSWLIINDPSLRLLCGSYAMNLATRDNLKVRRLIKSHWFQSRYGYAFYLAKDQDAKMKFETDKSGYRMCTSVGSSTTGEGGDILILDDPHNIDEKESNQRRETALDWFDNTWSTRLNDQQHGAMVVVGQRIHEQDVSGHILENNSSGEWTHLNLPAEYDPSSPCRTHTAFGPFWNDPRSEDNELLWPERFPRAVIERAKQRHGPLGYSALYGQRPVPPGGHVFKQSHERAFTIDNLAGVYLLHTPDGERAVPIPSCHHVTTSDVAIKQTQQSDYTVFETWAVTPQREVLLIDLRRARWSAPEQQEQARMLMNEYMGLPGYLGLFFEDVGYQAALGQNLLADGYPCRGFNPGKYGDKLVRAGAASIWMSLGKAYFKRGAGWVVEFTKELYTFPKAAYDDQVDPFSMMCLLVRPNGELDGLLTNIDSDTQELMTSFKGY